MLTRKEILSISSEIERILYLLLVAVNKGEEGERGEVRVVICFGCTVKI